MRREFIVGAALLCTAVATGLVLCASGHALASALASASAQEPVDGVNKASMLHGAELTALGDCATCHTAPGGAPFAGGRAFGTPFGTLYSTNITPDSETGIGQWSLQAFTRAMREGVARDGHFLYPAFPYPHFRRMTDADIASVYRFVMSRNAVHATAPKNHVTFPFNFRPLVAVWNWLYLNRDLDPSLVPADAQARRGKYLVDSVGHCAACHTPMNKLGAEKRGEAFEGGVIEGWEAPALTTLLQRPKPWTIDQLTTYLRTGNASEHGAAAGPMRPVTDSLADASADDLRAMAVYLLSLQVDERTTSSHALSHASSPSAGGPADRVQLQMGATLFQAACAACHDAAAPMSTLGDRPSLSVGTAVNAQSPRNAIRLILDGVSAENSSGAPYMPAFAPMLSDAQLADLTVYMRSRFSPQAPWKIEATDVTKLRKETTKP